MEMVWLGRAAQTQDDPIDDTIDPQALRAVCSHFITGVTVVTTRVDDGPVGITINSFTSVSLEPPLVLFCIHEQSGLRQVLQDVGVFAVNILAEDQDQVSRFFATTGRDRFTDVRTRIGPSGAPILTDALAYLDCRLVKEMEGGDHAIVLGEVVDADVQRAEDSPLTFFRSTHVPVAP
jgi:3-hydroxy-9,10-secoandrosta-1,3,5(10)-triene-9,17-dione monooxygenase reductase component